MSVLAAAPGVACGQDLEPRAYVNTPVGLNFLLASYFYTQGNVGTDPSLPVTDFKIRTDGPILAYVRTLDVWGRSGKLDVILPYVWLSAKGKVAGQDREREVSGFGDPRVRFSVNLYGAPALSVEQFSQYKQDLIVGSSLQVSAPGGQYDSDKLVNIGTNRWSFKPELGLSKAAGPLTLELLPSVTFFTDNDNFFGGKHVAQADLRRPGTRHLPLRLRCLGRVGQHLLHRGAHDRRRCAEERSIGECTPGPHRRHSAGSALLAQALWQYRSLHTHRQHL